MKKVFEDRTVWYKEGTEILHRLDGPAIEYADGSKFWYKEGKCHRENGPAVEYNNGDKFWYKDGKHHRLDGPAIERVTGKFWYKEGKYHRLDGPAMEYADGSKFWYVEGILYENVNSVEELIIKMIIE